MSNKYPIVAVTGSSGAGTTTVQQAFKDLFRREGISAASSRATPPFLRTGGKQSPHPAGAGRGQNAEPFGPDLHQLERLEALFREYAERGTGQVRHYVTEDNSHEFGGLPPGDLHPVAAGAGGNRPAVLRRTSRRHGGAQLDAAQTEPVARHPVVIERRNAGDGNNGVDVAEHVDLLIGVVPVVNLEWIQNIHRDTSVKGHTPEAVIDSILRRWRDYTHYITPQFSITDINFQRVPVVDTSNPFIARDVPSADESIAVIRFREPGKHYFPSILKPSTIPICRAPRPWSSRAARRAPRWRSSARRWCTRCWKSGRKTKNFCNGDERGE